MTIWKKITSVLILSCLVMACGSTDKRQLEIHFLDMVGGAATLIVTPFGESILIDTGSREPEHRDADRIFQAVQSSQLKQIDHLITTHFHSDHFGGILRVCELVPVKNFYDKGALPPPHEQETDWFRKLYPFYLQVTKGQAQAIAAGDRIPLRHDPDSNLPPLSLVCIAAEKRMMGVNHDVDAPSEDFEIRPADLSDNGRSIALVLRWEEFDFFAGGDITWNVEHHLAHPINIIGPVDLYQVTHHGLDQSNNPLLLRALDPTVCVAMNGPRKGIQPRTFANLQSLDNMRGLYQIHWNPQYGASGNAPPSQIANYDDPDKGRYIKAVVDLKKHAFDIFVASQYHATFPLR